MHHVLGYVWLSKNNEAGADPKPQQKHTNDGIAPKKNNIVARYTIAVFTE